MLRRCFASRSLYAVLAIAMFGACDGGLAPITAFTPIASITVSPTTVSIAEHSNATLVADLRDANNRPVTIRYAAWTSSDGTVVSINNGFATAVSPGTVSITASVDGLIASAKVTVTPISPSFVELSAPSANLIPGTQSQMVASVRASTGALLVGRITTWTSSNSAVASVANGVIVGITQGETIVTAHFGELSASALVSVTTPAFDRQTQAVGGSGTCALAESGQAYCWGFGLQGQLGNGRTDSLSIQPVPVSGGHQFVSIANAGWTYCGLKADGTIWCWGSGTSGRLGNSSEANTSVPVQTSGPQRYVRLNGGSAGFSLCAIDTVQDSWCWGTHPAWTLGTSLTESLVPFSAGTPSLIQTSSGGSVGCHLDKDGIAYCAGNNLWGEQGNGSSGLNWIATPIATAGVLRFTRLFAGSASVCGTRFDGTVWCWGRNLNGMLGDNTDANRAFPVQVAGQTRFERVMPGASHSCGLTAAGAAWCWGQGALQGRGDAADSFVPVPVLGGLVFTELAVGASHTCGRTADGVYCWGNNTFGQLGDGTRTERLTPTKVAGLGGL